MKYLKYFESVSDSYNDYYDENNNIKVEYVIGDDTQLIIDDLYSKAKEMNDKNFCNFWLDMICNLFENDKKKYNIINAYLRSQMPENELLSSKSIRSLALGLIHKRVIVDVGNITIKILDDNIMDKIDSKGKQILLDLANYVKFNYPNKKLEIAIGNQPISIAGDDGFRMTIPNIDSDVDDMFPYWSGVIPAYKELSENGVENRILWAAHDFLHEFGHTLGLTNEKETDKFAVKEVEKFINWLKVKPQGL